MFPSIQKFVLCAMPALCWASAFAQQPKSVTNPNPQDAQTLFVGDSITAFWSDMPQRFGIYGVEACVVRLHLGTDIALTPGVKNVMIEAGTNDILQGPGPGFGCLLPSQDPVDSIVDMVKTVQAAGYQPYVMSILPIAWNDQAGQPSEPYVQPLNAEIEAAVTPLGAIWVDAFDGFNGNSNLQKDGVHPNEDGYQVMELAWANAACAAVNCTAGATQTSLAVNATTIPRPATVTLTATVTPAGATGVVNFYNTNKSQLLGSVPLNAQGVAVLQGPTGGFAAGTYPVFAEYQGSANNIVSFSSTVDVTLQ